MGVSDRNDEIDVYYSETADGLTTAFKEHLDDAYRVLGDKTLQSKSIRAKVIRGDDYARQPPWHYKRRVELRCTLCL